MISGPWEFNNEAITPVIFSIQSIWSTAFSAYITIQKQRNKINAFDKLPRPVLRSDRVIAQDISREETCKV